METETKKEFPARNAFSIANAGGNKLSIPMAIILAGVLIAGAILLKGSALTNTNIENKNTANNIAPVTEKDRVLGNKDAKITFVLYEDFQCPFCGAIAGTNKEAIQYLKQRDPSWTPAMPEILNTYVKNGEVLLVYRDWPFLGADAKAKGITSTDESIRASEAALCANDQGKFWEYHDYLYAHQKGENEGTFSDTNLKTFAKNLGLDINVFNQCFDGNKYVQAITDQKNEGTKAGVNGTPKGFILKNGKVVNTIDGAEPYSMVKEKIDAALK